nr:helix-turn-helix transcriptional regulator [uncultured Carboxylicivirga sp.]
MIPGGDIQTKLFDLIREKIANNLSLAQEVAEILGISNDSAYRRIRGEKTLSLDEASQLCSYYNCSMDQFIAQQSSFLTFRQLDVAPGNFDKNKWLDFIYNNLLKINSVARKHILYLAKDPPIFQYFQFPEIASFKFFFWEKTIFNVNIKEGDKFTLSVIDNEIIEKCKKIATIVLKIPTTELWNEDTFRILLRQIEYYWISGYFASKEDLEKLINSIERWLNHNQKQAELGMKFLEGHPDHGIADTYTLYENEIILNDNTIFITTDDVQRVFITYNILGVLINDDAEFCQSVSSLHQTLISKSNMISKVGEKERNRFFNKLTGAIHHFKSSYQL